ncbi:MAG: hypothetical protein ACREDV_03145, partial [Methylocella sp.]
PLRPTDLDKGGIHMEPFAPTSHDVRIRPRTKDPRGLDAFVESSLAELWSFRPVPRRAFEADPDFGSPDTPARQVRASFVSCVPPSAAVKAITGPDPVGTIQAANTRAIALLDYVIRDLEGKRSSIRAGATTADAVEDIPVRDSLRTRFRMNADDRSIWTGTAARSVLTLIRRFRGARQILADGWMRYTCIGPGPGLPPVPLGDCGRIRCEGLDQAWSCGGHSRILLCGRWWTDDLGTNLLDSQAGTLLHEALHIYFGFIGDQEQGNFTNAHCYDHFVFDLNWLDVPAIFVDACP